MVVNRILRIRNTAFKMLVKWVFQNRETFEYRLSHESFYIEYVLYVCIYKWNLNSGRKGDYRIKEYRKGI